MAFSTLVLTAVLWGPGTEAAPPEAARELAYWRMVDGYAGEGKSEALSEVRSWSRSDLDAVLDSVGSLAKAARKCDDCEARARFEALPLSAATLLHSERDRSNRLLGPSGNSDRPDCQAGPDGRLSERLLELARQQPEGDDFAASFSIAMVMHHRSLFCLPVAHRWVRLGLDADAGNSLLLLVQGMVDETVGTLGDPGSPMATERTTNALFPDSRSARLQTARRFGYRKAEVKRASETFLAALKLNPGLTEARLRLGRIQWRMGELELAENSLRRALAESDKSTLFLARLFLGRVLEESGSIGDAVVQYEAAVALEPRAQIAAMALAHALMLRGEAGRAREVLDPVLGLSGRPPDVNHYWNYLVGVPAMAEARFEDLRVRAQK